MYRIGRNLAQFEKHIELNSVIVTNNNAKDQRQITIQMSLNHKSQKLRRISNEENEYPN